MLKVYSEIKLKSELAEEVIFDLEEAISYFEGVF
jgi:hypothetical protein